MKALLNAAWQGWKVIAHRIGTFQSRVILTVVYFVALGPCALGMKAFADPLAPPRPDQRGWKSRPSVTVDPMAAARRQF